MPFTWWAVNCEFWNVRVNATSSRIRPLQVPFIWFHPTANYETSMWTHPLHEFFHGRCRSLGGRRTPNWATSVWTRPPHKSLFRDDPKRKKIETLRPQIEIPQPQQFVISGQREMKVGVGGWVGDESVEGARGGRGNSGFIRFCSVVSLCVCNLCSNM